jgi:hypothetical protein
VSSIAVKTGAEVKAGAKADPKIARLLDELVRRLKIGAGHNLKAVVLYGTAVNDSGDLPAREDELNILCLLERAGAGELESLGETAEWLMGTGAPAPHVFTLGELERSADIFAIELLDMKRCHRILLGDDFLSRIQVPMHLHRLQVERVLRTNWVHVRQRAMLARGNEKKIAAILIASVLPFTGWFRHALMALGEEAPANREQVISRMAHLAGADPSAFQAALAMRGGKMDGGGKTDAKGTLPGYLAFIERAIDEIDRRLESLPAQS